MRIEEELNENKKVILIIRDGWVSHPYGLHNEG
jgi:hypothetical protein